MNLMRVLLLSLVALTSMSSISYGQPTVGDMSVEFKDAAGNAVCASKTGNGNTLTIAASGQVFTCTNGTVTIEFRPKSSGDAKVEMFGDDTQVDALRITNTLVKAVTAVADFRIIFKRIHPQLPTTGPGADQWYKTTIEARLSKVTGNYLRSLSYVTNPLSPPPPNEVQMGSQLNYDVTCNFMCGPNYYTPLFTLETTGQWPSSPNLGGDRELRVEFWFKLGQNSTLDLGSWIRLASQGNPDKGASKKETINTNLTIEDTATCFPESDPLAVWHKICPYEECKKMICVIPEKK